jgi:hypothetical protein
MSRGGIDASLFTSAGSNIGANIGGGLSKLGTGIGGMLQSRADAKNKEAMQAEVQKELQQYANDPAQLNAMGQKYQSMGKPDVAKAFYEAAKQATTKRTAQVSALETGGQDIQKEAQRKRAVQVARQKGDQGALTALNARAMDPAEYLKSQVGKKPEEKDLSLTTESVVETDPETGKLVVNQYRIGYNKSTGAEVSRQLIGRDEDQGKAPDDKRSITELLIEAGVPEDKIDLNTIEGLQVARTLVVDKVQNASLANTLTSMIEEKTPPGVGDAFELLAKIDPEFVSAQEDVARVEKFKALSELSSEDMSGLKNLLERVVSGTTESDVRAVSELQQFRGDKDLINKFNDFVLGVTSGRLSQETIQEYGTIMEVVGELAKKHQINTLDALIVSGSAREAEAASKALDFITRGEGTARVIPNS